MPVMQPLAEMFYKSHSPWITALSSVSSPPVLCADVPLLRASRYSHPVKYQRKYHEYPYKHHTVVGSCQDFPWWLLSFYPAARFAPADGLRRLITDLSGNKTPAFVCGKSLRQAVNAGEGIVWMRKRRSIADMVSATWLLFSRGAIPRWKVIFSCCCVTALRIG